jgi:hypothetical protein
MAILARATGDKRLPDLRKRAQIGPAGANRFASWFLLVVAQTRH